MLHKIKWANAGLVKLWCLLVITLAAGAVHAATTTFTNPVFENGADPWVVFYKGNYYSTTTTWSSQLEMRKSPTLAGLADATPVNIWSETNEDRCCNFWAFEFHRLKGPNGWRWYVLYTSGRDGTYDYQHQSVLESVGDDPMGPYEYKGSPMEDSYNIDGSYITIHNQLYLMYSQWQGDEQRNFIIKMQNPWTVEGQPTLLSRPSEDWERTGLNVNEGPEPLIHNGRVFVVYSASYCATPDYKLALLELTGDDPLDPNAWTKSEEPVFTKANGVYGPGHNGFFKSPDGTEDWLVYHGNAGEDDGCSTLRALRAQPFTWNADGTPNFGEPAGSDQQINVPSGENGPLWVQPEAPMMLLNQYVPANEGALMIQSSTPVIVDQIADGKVRLADFTGQFLSGAACGGELAFLPWQNKECQTWQFDVAQAGLLTVTNSVNQQPYSACTGEYCNLWGLSPLGAVAIVSAQSGKVVTATQSSTVQQPWTNQASQKWWLRPQQDGSVTVVADSDQSRCLNVSGNTTVFGRCDSEASKWYLHPRDEGGYRIVSKANQRLLDLSYCDLNDGVSVGVYDDLDNICQRFYLRDVN